MQFTPRQIRALSAEADVCENTVKRRLSGLPTRPSTGHRIEKAAKRMGFALPKTTSPSAKGKEAS